MFRKTIILSLIILTLAGIYFGALLPLKKSRAYIEASKQFTKDAMVKDFETFFGNAFDIYSPIGQAETAKFIGSHLVSFARNKETPEEVTEWIISFTEETLGSVERGKGSPNYTQLVLSRANVYSFAFQNHIIPEHFNKAEELYLYCLELSPARPQCIYGIFDLYRFAGLKEKEEEYMNIIRSFWPDDERFFEDNKEEKLED